MDIAFASFKHRKLYDVTVVYVWKMRKHTHAHTHTHTSPSSLHLGVVTLRRVGIHFQSHTTQSSCHLDLQEATQVHTLCQHTCGTWIAL